MGCLQREASSTSIFLIEMINNHGIFSQILCVWWPVQSAREIIILPAFPCPRGPQSWGQVDVLVSSHYYDPCFVFVIKGPGTTKTAKSSTVPPGLPVYLDLCYIPNHSNSKNVDVEFFKRVRSSYYVVSGNDPAAEEPSRAVLDALLEGKAQWGSNMQVRAHVHHLSCIWARSRGGDRTMFKWESLWL